ncbi:ead/Ea22-like family protein [Pseudocitrobacter faecalis]|uniref:ead/Ea22-like family protein n=1 Tax=Pseudocitrobacter faecalis TaxID=1398493 RepID=UPI0039EE67DD
MSMTTELAQRMKAAALNATGAYERLSVMPEGDIFDISLAEGTQLDADITALNSFHDEATPANVLALVEALEATEKRVAELEAREVKPVAWMRNANVTSFMSRFTTNENYAVEQWGDDAVALYSLPVDFIPACFTDERNLMHINERGRETSLIWSDQNSDSGDIKLFRIAAAAGKGE